MFEPPICEVLRDDCNSGRSVQTVGRGCNSGTLLYGELSDRARSAILWKLALLFLIGPTIYKYINKTIIILKSLFKIVLRQIGEIFMLCWYQAWQHFWQVNKPNRSWLRTLELMVKNNTQLLILLYHCKNCIMINRYFEFWCVHHF